MRTFSGKGGRKVDSPYTDEEAIGRLRGLVKAGVLAGDFPRDLSQRSSHSEAQLAWVHILVVESESKEDNGVRRSRSVVMPSLQRIRELFARANSAGLRAPKVRMDIPGVGRVQLTIAGPRSKLAGQIVVTDGGGFGENRYYGHIRMEPETPDRFQAGALCTPGVVRSLIDLALDPAGAASAYGKITGSCCFCALDLTDARSIAVGYGPTCADNYGLPWGELKVETDVKIETKAFDQMGWS